MRFIFTSTPQPTRLFNRIFQILVGLAMFGIILTIAAFLFIYIAIFAAAVFGFLWWKTRKLRKNIRNASKKNAVYGDDTQGGYVIEGEIIRETSTVPTVLLDEVTELKDR